MTGAGGQVFATYADTIIDALGRPLANESRAELMADVSESYIEHEVDPDLQRLGEVLVVARQQAMIQGQLNEDREQLHSGRLSHEEDLSIGHHYEMLRHAACEYNHLLRGFIEANRDHVSREELTDWLTAASLGSQKWAVGEITGALSEIALHAALMGMPEITGLRYGTLEEDLHGYDFVAQWQGQTLTVDAKTGYYQPLAERKHGHRHLEISVPRETLNGFTLSRHGLQLLRREVRGGLHAQMGYIAHSSHVYYPKH